MLGPAAMRVGADVHPLPRTKPAWLLVYLAAHGGWVTRGELAYLLRADSPESVARHYVRNLLHRAGKLPNVHDLILDSTRCRWLVDSDVQRFRRAVRAEKWHQALSHYKGPFMDGLSCDGARVYDGWLQTTRSELHQAWRHASLQYASDQESSGRFGVAASTLTAVLDQDLLDEQVVQACLRSLYLAGERDKALKVANRFQEKIASEMDLEPLPATIEILHRIRNGETMAPAERRRSRRRRWTDSAPDTGDELQSLIRMLKDPNNRLLTVMDSEAAGKETLVVSRRIEQPGLALFAIVDLAESLIDDGHGQRALELMVLVMSHVKVHATGLTDRIERVWDRLEQELPVGLVADARLRW